MITRKSTKKVALLKRLVILPILLIVVFIFAGFDKTEDLSKNTLKFNNGVSVKFIEEKNEISSATDSTKVEKKEATVEDMEKWLVEIDKKSKESWTKHKKIKQLISEAKAKNDAELLKKYEMKLKALEVEEQKLDKKRSKIKEMIKERKSI